MRHKESYRMNAPTYALAHDPVLSKIYDRLNIKDQNFISIFTGDTGSGKSGSAISTAIQVDVDKQGFTRWYDIDRSGDIQINKVVFTAKDFLKLITDKSKPLVGGEMIIWDEAGVEQDNLDYQSMRSRFIKHILQTYRYRNLGLILTVPDLASVLIGTRRLLHAKCTIMGDPRSHHSRNKYRLAKWHWLKRIKDGSQIRAYREIYYETDANNNFQRISNYLIPKPPNDVLKKYTEIKESQTKDWYSSMEQDINEMQNVVGGSSTKDKFDYIVTKILENDTNYKDHNGKYKSYAIEAEFEGISTNLAEKVARTLNHYKSINKLDELLNKITNSP